MLRYLALGAKIALSAVLVHYAFGKIDVGEAWRRIAGIPLQWVVLIAALLAAQIAVASLRLRQILAAVGHDFGFFRALDTVLIGAFFSQAFISFVGGDAMRIWRIARFGVPIGGAARAVVLDRVAGFAGLIALVMLTLPGLFAIVTEPRMRLGLLLAISLAGAGFLVLAFLRYVPGSLKRLALVQWLAHLSATASSMARDWKTFTSLLGISLAIQALNVVIFYVIGVGLSVRLGLVDCLILVPPVLFISMLPISFAGWGVREGAAIAAFSLVGIEAGEMVTVSVFFGLSVLVISLPGALLWFWQRGTVGPRMTPETIQR